MYVFFYIKNTIKSRPIILTLSLKGLQKPFYSYKETIIYNTKGLANKNNVISMKVIEFHVWQDEALAPHPS